jgi:S1-C subfamily serine protease
MLKMVLRLGLGPVLVTLGLALAPALLAAPLEPGARDRVLSASVQLAVGVRISADGATYPTLDRVTVGSGTVVSPTGLILTNWHVVDAAANRGMLDAWEAEAAAQGGDVTYELDRSEFFVLTTEGNTAATLAFRAKVVEESRLYDFAVLQVTADAYGDPLEPSEFDLAYVEIGDSEAVRPADPVYVFGYPYPAEGTLQVTSGVVGGFMFQGGISGPAWITSDAETFYGSSGGAAVDANGALIGVPTQRAISDCAPLDSDAATDDADCIPIGESLALLRPVHLARPLLAEAGFPPG